MNSSVQKPAVGEPVPESSQRPGLRTWLAFGTFALVLLGLVLFIARPRLTAEERFLVGCWYGLYRNNTEQENYAWLDEFGEDQKMRVTFRNYRADEDGTGWRFGDHIETGRWQCRDGRMSEARWSEGWHRPSVFARLGVLLTEGVWPRDEPFSPAYDLVRASGDDIEYFHAPEGRTYHAIRVPADFVLPVEPMTVEEVRVQLANRAASAP